MAKTKYYVVWKGRETGVYSRWDVCKKHVDGFEGAEYKSFASKELAEQAFASTYDKYKGKKEPNAKLTPEFLAKYGEPNLNSIAVDAACSGNPGKMEYRGVNTKSKVQLFHKGPFEEGTNNIGEFLALVHGLALLKKKESNVPIYSDSRIAISWVKQRKCKTKLENTMKTKELFSLIARAEKWLRENPYTTDILKWETKVWGEIPADFGRK